MQCCTLFGIFFIRVGSKFSEFQSRDDHDEDEIKSRQFFGPDSDSDTLTTVIHRRRSQTMTRASSTGLQYDSQN